MFEKAGILPKRPPPFGSLFLYDKPARYSEPLWKYYNKRQRTLKAAYYGKQLLEEEKARIVKNEILEREALARAKLVADRSQLDTTDIEANDSDAESRIESFAEISRRLTLHLEDMGEVSKGSDFRTAAYIRKLNLLAKKGLCFKANK